MWSFNGDETEWNWVFLGFCSACYVLMQLEGGNVGINFLLLERPMLKLKLIPSFQSPWSCTLTSDREFQSSALLAELS